MGIGYHRNRRRFRLSGTRCKTLGVKTTCYATEAEAQHAADNQAYRIFLRKRNLTWLKLNSGHKHAVQRKGHKGWWFPARLQPRNRDGGTDMAALSVRKSRERFSVRARRRASAAAGALHALSLCNYSLFCCAV